MKVYRAKLSAKQTAANKKASEHTESIYSNADVNVPTYDQ